MLESQSQTAKLPRGPAQSRACRGEQGVRVYRMAPAPRALPPAQALTSAARTAWFLRLPRATQCLRDLLEMRAPGRGLSVPRVRAETPSSPARSPAPPHLHQALGKESAMAPQLSAQPAPCGSFAHLLDHVSGRQTQLALLLRAVSGQDQHLCGGKRGSEEPSRTAEEQGGV